jgi:two-component system cell cycle response regulator
MVMKNESAPAPVEERSANKTAPETKEITVPRETLVATPRPLISTTNRQACLVHIYPTGPGMGARYMLADTRLTLGRDNDCDICLSDLSVSRHHARIQPGMDGYYVVDLQSTNGTFVNDKPASMCKLKDGDYLRFGNWIFRYLTGGNVEADYHEEIYRLTIIDALTGIHNKRYLLDFLDRELARSARHRRPLSIGMLDIDHFKAINDQMGHLAGDYALRELARLINEAIRREELFTRYGGEEFALVWPEIGREGAILIGERLRDLVEKHFFGFEDRSFTVTISMGIATTEGEPTLTPTDLIRRADEKLYAAKQMGRNRVVG